MNHWSKNDWIRAYWSITAIVVLTIAGRAMLGHFTGIVHYYQWKQGPNQVGMALNTAICLLLLGGAVGARRFWKDNE